MLCGRVPGKGNGHDAGPELALLAAILLQAIRDARAGDAKAAGWLASSGVTLADEHFDIDPTAWAGVAHGGRVSFSRATLRAPAATSAERSRAYYWRRKAASPSQAGQDGRNGVAP